VCGTHMVFEPFMYHAQQEGGVCSSVGVSAVLDQEANGFVKGESISAVLLQRGQHARRIYATVLTARVNIDGFKTVGMYFPSSEAQTQLMVDTYTDATVDPLELTYFEAHCTGTKVLKVMSILQLVYQVFTYRLETYRKSKLFIMRIVKDRDVKCPYH